MRQENQKTTTCPSGTNLLRPLMVAKAHLPKAAQPWWASLRRNTVDVHLDTVRKILPDTLVPLLVLRTRPNPSCPLPLPVESITGAVKFNCNGLRIMLLAYCVLRTVEPLLHE